MSTLHKPLLISFAEKYTALTVSFFSTLVLARLLTPEEIGIFSVGAVFVGLAHMLRNFGATQYVIQERELTDERVRAALGVTLLTGWSVAAALALASPYLAGFYGEPLVRMVLLILSINFVMLPFGSIALAVLRRDLQFGAIYRIKTGSALVHAGAAITLAALGYGALSLAWAAVAGVVTTVLLISWYRPKGLPYVPGYKGSQQVIKFGGFASISQIAKEIGRGAPEMIIGKVVSMAAVGIFGRAMGLIRMFERSVVRAVMPVVLPHFSSQMRAVGRVSEPYIQATSYVMVLAWPFFGFLSLMAFPIVRTLYGPQWDAAVPIAQLLCGYAALRAPLYFSDQALTAVGAIDKSALFHIILQPIVVVAVIVASQWGLAAVAYSLTLTAALGLLLACRILTRNVGMSLRSVGGAVLKVSGVTVCTMAIPGIIFWWQTDPADLLGWEFVVASLGACLGWVVGVIITRHPIRRELQMVFNKLGARTFERPIQG